MRLEPPTIEGVLETVLYFADEAKALRFYRDVLGFRLIGREPGRNLFFRAGGSVFLLFGAEATREPGRLPPHGASGSVHTCFRSAPGDYETWKRHLAASGTALLHEQVWPGGARSFYFHDPDGNLLEIADDDLWPR